MAEREANLHGDNHVACMNAIHADIENIQAACLWAAAHGHFVELTGAIESLGIYYRRESSCVTGDRVLERLARVLDGVTDRDGLYALAHILTWRSYFIGMLGDAQTSFHLVEQTLAFIHSSAFAGQDMRNLEARLYLQYANTIWVYTADAGTAEKYFRRSLNLFKQLDDAIDMALASLSFGRFQRTRKRYTEAGSSFSPCHSAS